MISSPRRTQPQGFTLLELILVLIIGVSLSMLLIQISHISIQGTDAPTNIKDRFLVLQEAEKLNSDYRDALEAEDEDGDDLDLSTLLSSFEPSNSVTKSITSMTITSTDNTITFSGLQRARLTKDGQSFNLYFTE